MRFAGEFLKPILEKILLMCRIPLRYRDTYFQLETANRLVTLVNKKEYFAVSIFHVRPVILLKVCNTALCTSHATFIITM